jgi:hypothetical protein
MKNPSNSSYSKIILILFGILFLLPINTKAQENIFKLSNASFAEKIYLQLDRKVYTTGETVWFKCIVSNATEHTPSLLSGVLYVELIGAEEVNYQKKTIKIKNGIGQGDFVLGKKIPKGKYLIRAYTQWNQNFDTDFVFEEYIQVFTIESRNKEAIQNIKLIKEETGNDHLEVLFNPQVIDSLQKNKLNVYITVDTKKDSLILKKDKKDQYILDYEIKKDSQLTTFKIETENGKTFSKTVILNNEYLDLQFFPESGPLVHGLSSKVGFKALDSNGKGKFVTGDIMDENQAVIASFKSNSLGMGSFFMDNIDSAKKYYAKVHSQSLKYPLPKVASSGTILSVNKQMDKVVVKAFSNDIKNDSIYLRISFRGADVYEKKAALNQGTYQALLSIADIPEGIVAFTLLDNSKNPMARRLYFNEKPESRLKINLSTDKEKYTKRDLTNLNILTTNANDEPVKANTSVLVINKKELGALQNLRQNILSYFLIDSELKGTIENPGFYFKNNTNSFTDLEALMLTQGWSKYNYSKTYQTPTIYPEKALTVSGSVNKLFSKKGGKKGVVLTMITFGKNKAIYNQETDSLGKFNFYLNDEYGKEIELLFQTSKNSGQNINNEIVLDQKKAPLISFEQDKAIEEIDSIVQPFLKKSIKQKELDDKFSMQFGGVLLNEVKITAKMSANKQKVTERFGKPETIISGKEIRSKEEKWSYGLYSVLLFNYPDKVRIKRDSLGNLQASLSNNLPTLVVIDGIPVIYRDYGLIPSIPPSEISSFEIIENAPGFIDLFCEVHPEISNCEYGAPREGNVIAIYTHAGIGLFGAVASKGLTQSTLSVFDSPTEFYAPKYNNMQPDDWKYPDIRSLIHWQPILKTDDLGKATTSFYNADNKEEMTVIIEAISDKGEIGYKELDYQMGD